MAVPDFQTLMLPHLESLADGKPHSTREVADAVAKKLSVTAEERTERIPSGGQTKFVNRIAWVGVHLMIDHDLGVTPVKAFAVKRIDSDYFEEA